MHKYKFNFDWESQILYPQHYAYINLFKIKTEFFQDHKNAAQIKKVTCQIVYKILKSYQYNKALWLISIQKHAFNWQHLCKNNTLSATFHLIFNNSFETFNARVAKQDEIGSQWSPLNPQDSNIFLHVAIACFLWLFSVVMFFLLFFSWQSLELEYSWLHVANLATIHRL